MNFKKNILVVAAHPDDEVLGCGGTIAIHVENGDNVNVIFFSDGVTSRNSNIGNLNIDKRKHASIAACKILGVNNTHFLGFPDNRLDTIPLLDLVQDLECVISKIKPSVIYTHHAGDLNIDHKIVHQTVMTACRPQPNCTVREIYSFEVLSSTEWSSPSLDSFFMPNKYVNISSVLDLKLLALDEYNEEMRDFPHSRSIKSVISLANFRGASMGMVAAEAFKIDRILS